MIKKYEFCNAKPLLLFLTQQRDKLIGQHIKNFYSSAPFGVMSDTDIAFELDDYSIVISYFFYSDLTLYIVDSQTLKDNLSLNFLYKDVPESRNLVQWISEEEFPFIGKEISDITIKRFSHEFEINPATGETRPNGGDYFSVITVILSDGQEFHICAADTICDGYVKIW
ncbi:MAG: hypothetical protein Q4E35_09580 [Eubacteriales bacterium]|nr:hypothetical protein [Eubacteriales bacterium]